VQPIAVSEGDSSPWKAAPPLIFKVALAWRKYGPRAKSAVARLLGRTFGRGMRTSVTLAGGALLAVDPGNLDIYMDIVVNGGFWDEHVMRTLRKVVRAGDVVYDIGANAGAMSIDLASQFKDSIKLVAIEPIPSLVQNIVRSVSMNDLGGTMQVYEFMLGNQEGVATLNIPSHAIHASAIIAHAGGTPLKRDVHRLDDLVKSGALPAPTVVKIDVEGGELDVFRGAMETFRAQPPIVLFEADWNMEKAGFGRIDLLNQLRAAHAGYRFYYVPEGGAPTRPATDENEPISDDTGNMIAMPTGRELVLD
jgi:FkbM family methyltransferase